MSRCYYCGHEGAGLHVCYGALVCCRASCQFRAFLFQTEKKAA